MASSIKSKNNSTKGILNLLEFSYIVFTCGWHTKYKMSQYIENRIEQKHLYSTKFM